ncbi:MAG: TolC family protein [Sphingobacteriaceae bacterium]
MAVTAMWLTFTVALPVYAQQQEAHTLSALWLKVEANYPGIYAKQSAIEAASLRERAVKSNMLPQVNAQAQNSYGTYEGSAGAFFPQPGFFNVSGAAGATGGSTYASNTFVSATLELELFSFGKLRKENQAATAMYDKTVSDKDAYLLSLKKELSQRYISLLYNDAKFRWMEKNAARLAEIRKISSGLAASGLKPAADSLLASSSHNGSLGELDQWLGSRSASIIKVMELYGGDSLTYAAAVERFAAAPAQDYKGAQLTIDPAHPILKALDRQSDYYALSGEAIKSSALPSVNLLGGYAYRGTGIHPNNKVSGAWADGFSNGTNNVLAGIGITWNITSLHTNRLKGAGLFKDAESTQLQQTQYQGAMQADLAASGVRLLQQQQQLRKTKLSVKQAHDAYQMYQARYKSGLISLTELLQIQQLLEQAENNAIEATRSYWLLLAYEAELTANFDFLFHNL